MLIRKDKIAFSADPDCWNSADSWQEFLGSRGMVWKIRIHHISHIDFDNAIYRKNFTYIIEDAYLGGS